MNTKKFLLAGLARFAVIFALGSLWHKVALGNFYVNQLKMAADMNMAAVVIGFLATGFLLSFIYSFGYKGGSPALEGYRFGILMGAVWMLPTALIIFIASKMMWPIGVLVDAP